MLPRNLRTGVIAELSRPFSIEDNQIHIGVSVGIALGPEHSINPDDLMKMSDMALYRAKELGCNCYRVFDIAMTDAMSQRHELESDLRRAIECEQLTLYYQPIVDATTRRTRAVEALIRWRHPTKGMIMPDRFHSACRGSRTNFTDWRMGALHGLRRGRDLAGRYEACG